MPAAKGPKYVVTFNEPGTPVYGVFDTEDEAQEWAGHRGTVRPFAEVN